MLKMEASLVVKKERIFNTYALKIKHSYCGLKLWNMLQKLLNLVRFLLVCQKFHMNLKKNYVGFLISM